MDNVQSADEGKIFVIAVCGKTMPDYNDLAVNATPTSGSTVSQGCGEASAIGGGHRIGGGDFDEGFLTRSIVSNPTDFNAFDASMTNDASHDLQFTAYSICGDPSDFG